MTEQNSELRAGINKVDLIGVVKEHKLKEEKNKDGVHINGSLIIKTGEFSEIELNVYVNEKTSKGNDSKVFKTLKGFLDGEYNTIASCQSEEDIPTKVNVYGNGNFTPNFNENIFKPQNSPEVVTRIRINLGFGTIAIDNTIKEEDFKATFDIEMCVSSVTEETDAEQVPTGRAVIDGYVPLFNGSVFPIQLVAGKIKDDDGSDIDFGQDLLDGVEEGQTVDFWGDLNYKVKITTVKKGGTLGRAKVEEQREYINELVTTGAEIEEDENNMFDPELIKKALAERENKIEEIKNAESKPKNKGLNNGNKKRNRPNF